MAKKILIIPHHPQTADIKIRLIELAKYLPAEYEVYVLRWTAAESGAGIFQRIRVALRDMFRGRRVYREDKFWNVEISTCHRPLQLAVLWNAWGLKRMIEKEKFDIVVNGSYYLFPLHRNCRHDFTYVFDFADVPAWRETAFNQMVHKQVEQELLSAHVVTAASRGLCEYLRARYHKLPEFFPNGADVNRIRSCPETRIQELRKQYQLQDKWVIGYIGKVGEWMRMDLLCAALREVQQDTPQATLLIVGADKASFPQTVCSDNVVFAGSVSPDEVGAYFSLIDVGVVPSKKNLFQDMAFHLKVIEYTAARKIIVSTPLQEVKNLNFPNILFAEETRASWVTALKQAHEKRWDPNWDDLVKVYDWQYIGERFVNHIDKGLAA